jgi:hypothetical protein
VEDRVQPRRKGGADLQRRLCTRLDLDVDVFLIGLVIADLDD